MKNLVVFFFASELNNSIETLNANELLNIRGGAEPVKPITRPRDEYDDEI